MTLIRIATLVVCIVLVLLTEGDAEETANAGVRIEKDVEFANVDGHRLELDLYLPPKERSPLVVWVHGGGWRGGSKEKCPVRWLAENGYAVASISYRLTDRAIFPAQIHDCKAAVRWLRANAERYRYDATRIGVAGSSAGGHLVALMGTSGGVEALEGTVGGNLEQSSRVDAVLDYYGATDFVLRSITQPHRANEKGSVVYNLLGGGADEKVEAAKLASAAYHVTEDDPPMLVMHGDQDKTVLLDQSLRIQEVYYQSGLPLQLRILEGSGHGGNEFYSGVSKNAALAFFDQHLKGHGDSTALPRSTPEEQGITSASLLDFVEESDETVNTMHSFMLVRNGHVVAECWWSPETADQPHILWSLSKSFTSTAIGMAVSEGKLDIDQRVVEFFPDKTPHNASINLRQMRVRDLLTMSTGHDSVPNVKDKEDWVKAFLETEVPNPPGTKFLYNTPATFMQSAILQRVTDDTLLNYLQPRLFAPLGIKKPKWETSPKGFSIGGYGLYLRTEDIAKFGQLYLQEGKWRGQQLIPASWVRVATSKHEENDLAPSGKNPDWREGYGFQFWRCRHGVYRGDGRAGQFCIVLPKYNAVVVMTAQSDNLQRQLDLVWKHLLPAFEDEELAANPDGVARLNERMKTLVAKKNAD